MRQHYFDTLRALFVSLGCIYHACLIFSPIPWAVNHGSPNQAFAIAATALHSFRMQGFFIISGLFSLMMLKKYGGRVFLKKRLIRLGIPLFFIGLTLNTFVQLHLRKDAVPPHDRFSSQFFFQGDFLRELWFLSALILFCLCLQFLYHFLPRVFLWCSTRQLSYIQILLLFLGMSLFALGVTKLALKLLGSHVFIFWPMHFGLYFPFFALGGILYLNKQWYAIFVNSPFKNLLLLLACLLIAYGAEALPFAKRMRLILQFPIAFSINAIIFHCAKRYFGGEIRASRAISDASYSMYLLHGPLLILLATVIVGTSIPVLVQFLLVAGVTWMLAYAIHGLIVAKSKMLTFLMNGQLPQK